MILYKCRNPKQLYIVSSDAGTEEAYSAVLKYLAMH